MQMKCTLCFAGIILIGVSNQSFSSEATGSVVLSKEEVELTLGRGLERLEAGNSVSDIVMRHIDTGG